MTSAASIFIARMAKSRKEQGDITLRCVTSEGDVEGKDIKAHSLILRDR